MIIRSRRSRELSSREVSQPELHIDIVIGESDEPWVILTEAEVEELKKKGLLPDNYFIEAT